MGEKDPETGTVCLCAGRIRPVFHGGRYEGWYNAKFGRALD